MGRSPCSEGGASNDTFSRAALRPCTGPGFLPRRCSEPFLRGQERAMDYFSIIWDSLPQNRGSLGCCLKGREAASGEPWLVGVHLPCARPHTWHCPGRTQLKHPRPRWTDPVGVRGLQPAHRAPRGHVPQAHSQGRHGAGLKWTVREVFTPRPLVLEALG